MTIHKSFIFIIKNPYTLVRIKKAKKGSLREFLKKTDTSLLKWP